MPDQGMLDNILGNSISTLRDTTVNFGLGNRFVYNRPINRSGDLLNKNILQLVQAGQLFQRSFYIRPPREKMNRHAVAIAEQLAAQLSGIDSQEGLGSLVRRLTVEELLEQTTSDNDENALLEGIQQSPTAGELLTATNRLNTKMLPPTDRFLLSLEGIYAYVLFLLNQGFGMSDEEVILTNIVPNLQRIKQYINVRLVQKIIEDRHLDAEDELPLVQERIKNRNLSYQGNQIERIVLKEFEEVSQGGPLIQDVINFLDTNEVPIPENISREQLIEAMVKFLSDLGIEDLPDADQGDDAGDPDPGAGDDPDVGPVRPVPADNFEEAIKGIGEDKTEKLYAAGIRTFSQLAALTVSELGAIITAQSGYTLDNYIDQAALISQGKFEELLSLKDNLPNHLEE
jgi:predicted flap endonuclease-1-like 5' DNA nuclease